MIFEIGGKKLVFGMDWPTLVEPGAYRTVAANRAFALKSPLLWHAGTADYAGYVPARAGVAAPSGDLYAAAQALLNVPNLPRNALLVARTPDKNFAAIGILGGRPANRFDRVGMSAEGLMSIVQEFGARCGEEGFALVGDEDAPLPHKVSKLTLETLAASATASCALRPPSRAALYKKTALMCAAICAFATVAWVVKDDVFPKEKHQGKTPTELYHEAVAAHASDPVVLAADYKGWYQWYRTSFERSYGGWLLTSIKCEFSSPGSTGAAYVSWNGSPNCIVTFDRDDKYFATVATFYASVPKEWVPLSTYNPQQDKMVTTLQVEGMRVSKLSTVLSNAGHKRDRDVAFVSRMQEAQRLVKAPALPEPALFLVPAGVPANAIDGNVYRATHWSITDGASQFVKLLDDFPAYATLSRAEFKFQPQASSNSSDSPYRISLEGELFTSN